MSGHHGHGSGENCDDCAPRAATRNHYFTGKLLVERDFTDEQWYFREKLRLHHQRLHGVGVVCGLDLVPHPNPACRDRMLVLQPGSAVDCCGHDILVVDPEVIVLDEFPSIAALKTAKDDGPHRLEFCLAYRECPTEEIPVLFDECGCDDSQCAPNRILESWALEVRVDAPLPEAHFHAPKLDWATTIGVAHAAFVALDTANHRLFALTGNDARSASPTMSSRRRSRSPTRRWRWQSRPMAARSMSRRALQRPRAIRRPCRFSPRTRAAGSAAARRGRRPSAARRERSISLCSATGG
jgi:hypothetical protein